VPCWAPRTHSTRISAILTRTSQTRRRQTSQRTTSARVTPQRQYQRSQVRDKPPVIAQRDNTEAGATLTAADPPRIRRCRRPRPAATPPEYRARHMADLAEALSLAALVAATLEYAILIRHRAERREELRWQREIRDSLMWARRINSPAG